MSAKVCHFCILQYHHSLVLNEVVNIGVLVYFPDRKTATFIPGNIDRVKAIYEDVCLTLLESSLKAIERLAGELGGKVSSFEELANTILIPDDSALQFSKKYTSLRPPETVEKTFDLVDRFLPLRNQFVTA